MTLEFANGVVVQRCVTIGGEKDILPTHAPTHLSFLSLPSRALSSLASVLAGHSPPHSFTGHSPPHLLEARIKSVLNHVLLKPAHGYVGWLGRIKRYVFLPTFLFFIFIFI
uniref:Uncharacterized protein n=1 Tax=Arundo donax TaxID=35708 RepID=A0A0A9GCG9_ARUDO